MASPRKSRKFLPYGKETGPDQIPTEGTPERDYWNFTKQNQYIYRKIDFDGKVFTCHLTPYDFKQLTLIGRIQESWDTYRGVKYAVKHVTN